MREEITLQQALSLLEDYHTNKISVVTVHLLTQYPNKILFDTGRDDDTYNLHVAKSVDGVVSLEDDRSTINFREDQCFLVNINKSELYEWVTTEILFYVDVIGESKDE